ncbi:MAG: hypothetical protein EOO39_27245 [Cytophagaceae bacterium]|nr:MAG: hypothetical protein EOO39_27245 [Cytophagaceae bacterium]
MARLSQLSSAKGASSLRDFALEVIEATKGESSSEAAVSQLRQSLRKQIEVAAHYQQLANRGRTARADQQRYEEKFAEAKDQLQQDLDHLPEEIRQDWL